MLWSSVLFVAGFSLVFAVLEAGANTAARPLRAHPALFEDLAGALIIAMGLAAHAGRRETAILEWTQS